MSQTILAFDFGTHSIGVAVGQTLTQTAKELKPLKAQDGIPNWEVLASLLREWQPQQLVVGLPSNMDDTASELGLRAKKFANRLRERFSLPVDLLDERLTTVAAKEEAMARRQKLDFKKNPVDSIAARLILESWFYQQSTGRAE